MAALVISAGFTPIASSELSSSSPHAVQLGASNSVANNDLQIVKGGGAVTAQLSGLRLREEGTEGVDSSKRRHVAHFCLAVWSNLPIDLVLKSAEVGFTAPDVPFVKPG